MSRLLSTIERAEPTDHNGLIVYARRLHREILLAQRELKDTIGLIDNINLDDFLPSLAEPHYSVPWHALFQKNTENLYSQTLRHMVSLRYGIFYHETYHPHPHVSAIGFHLPSQDDFYTLEALCRLIEHTQPILPVNPDTSAVTYHISLDATDFRPTDNHAWQLQIHADSNAARLIRYRGNRPILRYDYQWATDAVFQTPTVIRESETLLLTYAPVRRSTTPDDRSPPCPPRQPRNRPPPPSSDTIEPL